MSGRGKGGKGLGAGQAKKQKTAREAEAEAYEWKDGEGIVVISYANNQDCEIQIYSLPDGRVHPLLKPAVKASSGSQIYIQLSSDDDENSDLFDNLTAKDIRKWQNGEQGDDADDKEEEGEEEGEEEEEEEIDGDEKEDLLDSISTWVATLGPWRKNPPTAVKIACRISVYESA